MTHRRPQRTSFPVRSLTAIAATAGLLLALAAPPASAVQSRVAEPFSPIDGSSKGLIALEQSSGNLFLARADTDVVHLFGADGGAPAGLTAPFQISAGFDFRGHEFFDVAVDNWPASPNQGTVYVGDSAGRLRIFTLNEGTGQYEPDGELVGSPPFGGISGIATAPDGRVFVSVWVSSRIYEFGPTGVQLKVQSVTGNPPVPAELGASPGPLAVHAGGDLFVTTAFSHEGGVVKFIADASGNINRNVYDVVRSASGQHDLAVDPDAGRLFLALNDRLLQLDATSYETQLEFGVGVLPAGQNQTSVAANPSTDRVYAVSNKVHVFGPPVTVPGVVLGEASAISATAASVEGTVNPDSVAIADCRFEYGTSAALGSSVPCAEAIPADDSDHAVSAELTGLDPATTYHFRLAAENSNGPNYTSTSTFKTQAPAATDPATDVSGTRATLNGTVIPAGQPVTECRFDYGLTTSYGSSVPCAEAIPADDADHAVSAQLTNLQPNGTTYHFRIVTVGAVGTTFGANRSFKTAATVITGEATGLAGDAATLNGTLTPEGIPYTACEFEYGTTASYGTTLPCDQTPAQIGTGEDPVPVSLDISGLSPNTTYHFRLRGTNANGTALGADRTLRTFGPPEFPAVWTDSVGLDRATVQALVDPRGLPTTYRFEWGADATYGNASPEMPTGSGTSPDKVSFEITGLEPETTYHWRIVATNPQGQVEGPDQAIRTFAVAVPETDCPNQAFRIGPSAVLPDCRAYEMVSPVDKNGGDIGGAAEPKVSTVVRTSSWRQAAADGERITFSSAASFGDAVSAQFANQYLSSRTASGWSTHGISQPRGTLVFELGGSGVGLPEFEYDTDPLFQGFTSDLCQGWLVDSNVEPLTPDALDGYINLYRRDNCGPGADTFQALTNEGPVGDASIYLNHAGGIVDAPPGSTGPGLRFQGASEDLSHQLFVSGAQLTPEAAPGNKTQLYDFHDGELELVSVLPNGAPDPQSSFLGTLGAGNRASTLERAVSHDGSRIFWSSNSGVSAVGSGKIYLRVDGSQTLPVSLPPGVAAGEPFDARYWTAAVDGSAALFSSPGRLMDAPGELYRFDTEAALAGQPAVTLLAEQVLGVLGASEDLTRIYFASEQPLAPGAVAGQPNLYLREGAETRLVAVLHPDDALEISLSPVHSEPIYRASQITPDGAAIAFQSFASLTEYESFDPELGERFTQVYRYDALADALDCVSCNPSGSRPTGRTLLHPHTQWWDADGSAIGEGTPHFASGVLPTAEREQHSPRALSDDSDRLYFHSYEALVPGDTNAGQDVYQWEAEGAGGCDSADPEHIPEKGGCVSLVSTGQSSAESIFYDASADGGDVFFSTHQSLDPRDDGRIDVYDARVGGGLPPPPADPAGCEGEACRGASPDSPPERGAGSAAFAGPGNPPPGRDCSRFARAAKRQGRQARRLRARAARLNRAARRSSNPRRSRAARRQARRLAATARKRQAAARKQARRAKRCRASADRRAGR